MRSLFSFFFLGVLAMPQAWGYDRVTGLPHASRSEVIAQHGMAATSQPLATQVALDILKAGGSAVDAAIAANAMLGLTEPTGSGIGGDIFALVWDAKQKKLFGLNGSGRSPRTLTLAELQKRGLKKIPALGPLSVSVPGCVDGWTELHKKFGRLPLAQVLQPTIQYARQGFPVTEVIAYYWKRNAEKLKDFEGFSAIYQPGGKAPAAGEIFKNPALARTLEIIAAKGRDGFYTGPVAQAIADYMKKQGGYLSYEDLASHRSEWVEPISTRYRGHDVWQLPPNGQGLATLQILNLLEHYDIKAMGFDSPAYVHTLVESIKLAFADRAAYYADPAFVKQPIEQLASKTYAASRKKLIDPNKAALEVAPGEAILHQGDTVYLTTADKDGNMVSLIQSNFRGMGSGMTPGGLGFVLQDRGELFSLDPQHANVYAPGKRPFHTIIPGFVTKKGEPWLSFGVMGGSMQPQGQVQILVNMIDFGMNLQEAGDASRIYVSGTSEPTGEVMKDGGQVALESGFSLKTQDALTRMGHKLVPGRGEFGGYQAILWDPVQRVYRAASESRKDGHAAGY
ncbi:MAG TPA: gamma-glutamyltransferase [Oligoflexus sp.]|uniref:gamma-glutamyltransferase n=1 Tax=Oligoflexus sp. TaxID=1971216 RepID=UPI002D8037AC|nr:gamma-glutamyltransferase [Oligoflexus sp.]HET9240357.1 gamma-glutamyltransferase [Oligoflexus sp.]